LIIADPPLDYCFKSGGRGGRMTPGCAGVCALALLALAARVAAAARMLRAAAGVTYYGWSGAYLGVNGGYGFGVSHTNALFSDAGTGSALTTTGASSRLNGMLGGAQAVELVRTLSRHQQRLPFRQIPGMPVTACASMRPCASNTPAERSPASRTEVLTQCDLLRRPLR
jgi:hypothetical protein